MKLIPQEDDEGEYTNEFKASLKRSLLNIKNNCIYSMKEVKEELGIECYKK